MLVGAVVDGARLVVFGFGAVMFCQNRGCGRWRITEESSRNGRLQSPCYIRLGYLGTGPPGSLNNPNQEESLTQVAHRIVS